MKRIVTLFICCLMLFGTVAFAEDTAYSKLNDLEKEIYDCFMIMVSNFHNPKDARIYEMYDYKNNEENRKKLTENPSTSDINIQRAAADSIKIKVQSTNGLGAQETGIYQLFLSTWCNPVDGAKCKEFIDNTQALGLKMGSALLADNKSRNCKRGDYVELDSEPTFKTSPDADIGNINRPLIKNPQKPPVKQADYVIIESTYGNRLHGDRPDYILQLTGIIQSTFDNGGNVVIPSFAVGRTQELLYLIRIIKEKGLIKKGDKIILVAFGGGLTWSGLLIQW